MCLRRAHASFDLSVRRDIWKSNFDCSPNTAALLAYLQFKDKLRYTKMQACEQTRTVCKRETQQRSQRAVPPRCTLACPPQKNAKKDLRHLGFPCGPPP